MLFQRRFCPFGMLSIPARMISIAYAAKFTTIAVIAAVFGDILRPTAGSPKKMRKT